MAIHFFGSQELGFPRDNWYHHWTLFQQEHSKAVRMVSFVSEGDLVRISYELTEREPEFPGMPRWFVKQPPWYARMWHRLLKVLLG